MQFPGDFNDATSTMKKMCNKPSCKVLSVTSCVQASASLSLKVARPPRQINAVPSK